MDKSTMDQANHDFSVPLKWCRTIIKLGYVTAALIVLAHLIWYYAARSVLAYPPDVYLRNYIILPACGLAAVMMMADLAVCSRYLALTVKEFIALAVFTLFSGYLCLTHPIAKVLFGSFIMSIFVSTIFSNVRLTRSIFWLSCGTLLLIGLLAYRRQALDADLLMQIFVSAFMNLCSYLLAKVLIRYGHDNLLALKQLDQQQKTMEQLLKLDPYTGLSNRKTFDEQLISWLTSCRTASKKLALAMIDVDCFKQINDCFGHDVGDQVLLYLAELLKNIQTANIQSFRLGGDEFAILFKECDAGEAYQICERLRLKTEAADLPAINYRPVAFSCGLVSYQPLPADPQDYAKQADSALYKAKKSGRNQVVIFQPEEPIQP